MNEALCGFFGKVPTHGDFLSRRLPRSFLDPWDQWLQESIAVSREQLGERWLEAYLVSPLWRFCLSPGLCGSDLWAGIMMPSVDRVGRYFPLCIALSLPPGAGLFSIAVAAQAWFDEAQALILSALEDEVFELEKFDEQVRELGSRMPALDAAPALSGRTDGDRPWRIGLQPDSAARFPDALASVLHSLAAGKFGAYSLWWTEGSEHVEPSLLTCRGLPPAEGFAALLSGAWQQSGIWQDWSESAPRPATLEIGGDVSSSP